MSVNLCFCSTRTITLLCCIPRLKMNKKSPEKVHNLLSVLQLRDVIPPCWNTRVLKKVLKPFLPMWKVRSNSFSDPPAGVLEVDCFPHNQGIRHQTDQLLPWRKSAASFTSKFLPKKHRYGYLPPGIPGVATALGFLLPDLLFSFTRGRLHWVANWKELCNYNRSLKPSYTCTVYTRSTTTKPGVNTYTTFIPETLFLCRG